MCKVYQLEKRFILRKKKVNTQALKGLMYSQVLIKYETTKVEKFRTEINWLERMKETKMKRLMKNKRNKFHIQKF